MSISLFSTIFDVRSGGNQPPYVYCIISSQMTQGTRRASATDAFSYWFFSSSTYSTSNSRSILSKLKVHIRKSSRMTFLCDEEKKQCLDLVQPRPWTEGSGSFNLCLSINIDSHVRLSAVICDTSAPPPKRIATASCCPKYAAIVMGASQYRVFRFTKFASAPAFRSTRRTSRWPSWLALKTSAVEVLQREMKYERFINVIRKRTQIEVKIQTL